MDFKLIIPSSKNYSKEEQPISEEEELLLRAQYESLLSGFSDSLKQLKEQIDAMESLKAQFASARKYLEEDDKKFSGEIQKLSSTKRGTYLCF